MRLFIGLFFFFSTTAMALVPLEGLILGNVKDIKQFDPLEGLLTMESTSLTTEEERLKEYYGVYRNGKNLTLTCDSRGISSYTSPWKRAQAKASVAATLQYIGIDAAVKAIAEYAKLLNINESQYEILSDNLVNNYCSNNLSVYSKKLVRQNLSHYYDEGIKGAIPSLEKTLYPQTQIELSDSKVTRTRELLYTINNFKSLCSWGGDADDFRLMGSYLSNPFIFSVVMNHLDQKRVRYNTTLGAVVLEEEPNGVQVVCENLICRRVTKEKFASSFPHMTGATNFRVELETMYCNDFRFLSQKTQEDEVLKKWMDERSLEDPILESAQFMALMTKKSDIIFSANAFPEIKNLMRKNIQEKWDLWAKSRSSELFLDITYEEPLRVRLMPSPFIQTVSGNFSLNFDYTLGEFDQNLMDEDSLSMKLELDFSQNYLRWLRGEWLKAINQSNYKEQEKLLEKVAEMINHQLEKREDQFLINIWNKDFGLIMAKELTRQLETYALQELNQIDNKMLKLPVSFRFGLFALQYQYNKFQTEFRSKGLTFNQK